MILILGISTSYAQDFSQYEWVHFDSINSPLDDNHIREILFDDKNDLAWITTGNRSLFSFDGMDWNHYPFPKEWFQSWWLNSMHLDDRGVLWIAGYTGYIILFDTKTKTWDRKEIKGEQPWIIRGHPKGGILVGTTINTGRLYHYRNGQFELIEDRYKDPFHILFRPDGNAIVSFRKGVYEYVLQANGRYSQKSEERIFKHCIYEMDFGKDGDLWAASYSSKYLHIMKNGRWHSAKDAPDIIHYDINGKWQYIIHNVMTIPDGRGIISTQFNASISIYDGEEWESYLLPVINHKTGIERMRFAKDSSVWCGTFHDGLHIFRAPIPEELPDTIPEYSQPFEDGQSIRFSATDIRKVETFRNFQTSHPTFKIDIKDAKFVDGDIVSVFYNGVIILNKKKVSHTPFQFELPLKKGKNELLLYAHNLGDRPPNTAAMRVDLGNEQKEVMVDSDFDSCGRILIERH